MLFVIKEIENEVCKFWFLMYWRWIGEKVCSSEWVRFSGFLFDFLIDGISFVGGNLVLGVSFI